MSSPPPAAMMPARWVPLLYLGFAHGALATALSLVAADPRAFAGFFYHPRMVAVVHLVTLGWIGGSILGSIYIVGPLALRMPLPASRADRFAFGGYALGVVGMVTHFWIASPPGMAWSAGLAALCIGFVAVRVLRAAAAAPLALEARLPVMLAFANVLAAALLGVLLGVNKASPFLPVSQLAAVYAHAHLAAIGWGVMLVFGVGYRMLPMLLPAAMPRGAWPLASTLLLEAGVLGVAAAFLAGGRWLLPPALLVAAGIGAFLSRVGWMLRHRRPAPSELRRPDWGVAHAMAALAALAAAAGLGLWLAASDASEASLAAAPVYGVLGLLGFLSQVVTGVEARMLPLFAWLWGFADRGYAELPPSLHGAPPRPAQAAVFALWLAGLPLLAAGLGRESIALIGGGAVALLAAVLLNAGAAVVVLRRLWRRGAGAPG